MRRQPRTTNKAVDPPAGDMGDEQDATDPQPPPQQQQQHGGSTSVCSNNNNINNITNSNSKNHIDLAKKDVIIKLQADALLAAKNKVQTLQKALADKDVRASQQAKTIEELQQLLLTHLEQLVEANDKIRQLVITLEQHEPNQKKLPKDVTPNERISTTTAAAANNNKNSNNNNNNNNEETTVLSTVASTTNDSDAPKQSSTTDALPKPPVARNTAATPPVFNVQKKKRPPGRKRLPPKPPQPPSTAAATKTNSNIPSLDEPDDHDTNNHTTWWSQETVDQLQLKIQSLEATVQQLQQERRDDQEEIQRLERVLQELAIQVVVPPHNNNNDDDDDDEAANHNLQPLPSIMAQPSVSSHDSVVTTDDDDDSDDSDSKSVALTTIPRYALPPGHMVLLLVSSMPASPMVGQHQRHLTTILDGLQIVHAETDDDDDNHAIQILDGCDAAVKGLRDDLFRISGLHAVYPQLFLVQHGVDIVFVGDYAAVVELHDGQLLQDTLGLVPTVE